MLLASAATAQQVSGTVKDTQGKGIDKATVSLLREKDSSIVKLEVTGENGKYSFGLSQNGKYLISASHAGFEPVSSMASAALTIFLPLKILNIVPTHILWLTSFGTLGF